MCGLAWCTDLLVAGTRPDWIASTKTTFCALPADVGARSAWLKVLNAVDKKDGRVASHHWLASDFSSNGRLLENKEPHILEGPRRSSRKRQRTTSLDDDTPITTTADSTPKKQCICQEKWCLSLVQSGADTSWHSLPTDEQRASMWMQELGLNNGAGWDSVAHKNRKFVCGWHFSPDCITQTARGRQLVRGAKPNQTRAQYESTHPTRPNPKHLSPTKRVTKSDEFVVNSQIRAVLEDESRKKRSTIDALEMEMSRLRVENETLKKKLATKTADHQHMKTSVGKLLHRPRRTLNDLSTLDNEDVRKFYGICGGAKSFHAFFAMLNSDGAAERLNYWGTVGGLSILTPATQLLFLLFVLRSGVGLFHAAYDFGISNSYATRYFTTWLSFFVPSFGQAFFPIDVGASQKDDPEQIKTEISWKRY